MWGLTIYTLDCTNQTFKPNNSQKNEGITYKNDIVCQYRLGFRFLVKDNLKIKEAIQVTYALNNENFNREINGLAEAMRTLDIPKGTLIVFDNNLIIKGVQKLILDTFLDCAH